MSPFLVVDDANEASQESKPETTTQPDNKSETNTAEANTDSTKEEAKSELADKKAETNGELKSDASDEEPEPKKKVDAAEPMKAELKHLDRKYSEKHKWYFAETVEDKTVPDQVDWWTKYALCVTRYMSSDGKRVEKVVVNINSQHLKDLLKEAIGSYPGVSLDTKDITLTQPCRLLCHYFDEIKQHGEKFEAGSEAAAHYQVLLNHINEESGETIQEADNLREQGVMSYQHLWTVFKPKTIAFARVLGQIQAFRVLDSFYVCGQQPRMAINLQQVDFDGKRFGHRTEQMAIPAYLGAVALNKLDVVPRAFFPHVEEVEERLIARGRRFEQYAGIHFAEHAAIALEHVYNSNRGDYDINRVHISERVVIDCATHHRLNPELAKTVTAFDDEAMVLVKDTQYNNNDSEDSDDEDGYDSYESSDDDDNSDDDFPKRLDSELVPSKKQTFKPLTDTQCLLASALVHGFSFTHKKWIDMFIDELSPVEWDENCFDQLVLAPRQKKLVQALVTEHITNKNDFDDIIKGKGKGLVLVLHGPPGVGKTLTAECVAERCKRPLYVVSSGDLGTDSFTLDQRLTQILDMASTWRAVLLIDEADVFLERRSLHDMERNALVSIFLRVLEYYQGILFLTSNRVDTFDDAFKSRIHVPLKYTGLDISSRKQIWKNFLDRAEEGAVDDEGLEELAQHDLNGRQIKGIVRTATSLARYDGKKLDLETLEQVVEIQMDFERDLVGEKK